MIYWPKCLCPESPSTGSRLIPRASRPTEVRGFPRAAVTQGTFQKLLSLASRLQGALRGCKHASQPPSFHHGPSSRPGCTSRSSCRLQPPLSSCGCVPGKRPHLCGSRTPPCWSPPLLRSVLHPLSPHSPLSANRVPDTLRAGEQSPTQEGPSGPPPEAGVRVLYPVNGRVTLGTWEQKPGTCLCAQTRAINSNLQISSAKWW